MNDQLFEQFLDVSDSALKKALKFSHKAMGTRFELYIYFPDPVYAEQAAEAAFREIDGIEKVLSHYIENSDISKISTLMAHQSTKVTVHTMESLLHCAYLWEITKGLFDVTIGPLYQVWLDEDKSLREPSAEVIASAKSRVGMHHLLLDPKNMTVQVLHEGLQLDLGGYGKGYAIDCAVELLAEWDIENVLVHGGYSSLYAKGKPDGLSAWPLTITHPVSSTHIGYVHLSNQAMSASGLQKGQHIIHPHLARPVTTHLAAWAIGESAATVDGLTTAFMMMSRDDIESLCSQTETMALMITHEGSIESVNFPL